MSRSFRKLATGALLLAAGAAGCAHCDTCDDFPVPCTGPGCGGTVPGAGPFNMSSGDIGPGGPFTPSPNSAGGSPSMSVPPLPSLPADSPPPPPAMDAAPKP